MTTIAVRAARAGDAPALAALSTALGYPADAEQIAVRLDVLGERGQREAVFVAVDERDTAIGFVHIAVREELVLPAYGMVEGLDIEPDWQRRGVGRVLMAAAEAWAAARGVGFVKVRTRTERAAAHAFYEGLGYETVKEQKVMRKRLAP